MESLKKSMKWDEERFGLLYDLDIFMIVAVDDFNMGAMENKGLNVFGLVVLAKLGQRPILIMKALKPLSVMNISIIGPVICHLS
ncbi:hypothetical protein THIOSC13_570005 [uncultured Thiomicrorhabdus sp.]